jgi:hydrogenase expression/formation protein HypC
LLDDEQLARVDVNGVGRSVNIALLDEEALAVGDWVLIHVGFAMAKIDEVEARETLNALRLLGQVDVGEFDVFSESEAATSEDSGDRALRR